jgi:hypothetical protein
MTLMVSIEDAVSSIGKAFATVPYPGDTDIAYNQDYARSDGWDCAEVFRGKHWQDVPPAELIKCPIQFLTTKAFPYFLPAYMLARLEHSDEADVAGVFVVYFLKPPEKSDRLVEWLTTIDTLNLDQKRAVRLFLEAVADNQEDTLADARAALSSYWSQF